MYKLTQLSVVMDTKITLLTYIVIGSLILQDVELTCNKDTVKYMLVKVCSYTKRSFSDGRVFPIMSKEEVESHFNEMAKYNYLLQDSEMFGRYERAIVEDTSMIKKIVKRHMFDSMPPILYKTNGERGDSAVKMSKYKEDFLTPDIDDHEDRETLGTGTGINLFDKCCSELCTIDDFMGYCF